MAQDAAERLVGGRWMLHTPLRRAQRGVTWRATEVASGRRLAVEQLRLPAHPDPDGPEQAALWDRVAAETRAAAALAHPALVRLDDVVVEDGVVYVAAELVDGLTLEELVARHGPLPVRRVAQLGLELLDALEAAHRAGLAHLDLRPANVLVTADGHARLGGIGLATLRGDLRAGPEGATTAFLAPEQVRGDPAGPPADLWALGTVLAFAVEGEVPFAADGSHATSSAILHDPPRPPELAGPLTPTLSALLTKPAGGRPTIPETRRLLEPLAGTPRPAPGSGPDQPRVPQRGAGRWGSVGPSGVHNPALLPRAVRNAMDPVVQRVLLIAGGSVLLALVSFAVAVAVSGDPLGLRTQAVASTVATVAPTTLPPSTTAPPTTLAPSTTALVPPGWSVHTDQATGYQVAVPPGWQVVSDGGPRTELRDQSSPTLLRIDWRQDPPADPVTVEQQASQAHAGERGDYRQARLEPAEFKGLPAALLEFTYQDGETWHGLELGVRSPRHHIALAIYARDRDWGTGWALFEAFKASFAPPAT
ncbi:MAG TPA: protein kinase [Actinomycetota bacterium]|nr:protein kinase [Actinomycetota bacterium]